MPRERLNYGAPQDGLSPSASLPVISTEELLAYGMAKSAHERQTKVVGRPQNESKVKVETSDALHLMIVSNVLYGSRLCDVETFEKHLQLAQSLENTKVVFMGQLVSNRPRFDEIGVVEQHEYIKDWVDTLDAQGKVLAGVRSAYPNRPKPRMPKDENDWDEDVLAELELPTDPNEYLFENVSFPVLQNGGVLEVDLIDPNRRRGKKEQQTYRMALFSKAGSSRVDLNKNGPAKRAFFQKTAGNADIIVVTNPYIADVTQTVEGKPPTRQELTIVTAGGYLGNVTGEHPELTDKSTRDNYALDGEPGGQVITLFQRTKETRVHLRPEHFVYDYMVDALSQQLDLISDAGREADFSRSLSKKGIALSAEDRQILFQRNDFVNGLLEEQHHPQRRRS